MCSPWKLISSPHLPAQPVIVLQNLCLFICSAASTMTRLRLLQILAKFRRYRIQCSGFWINTENFRICIKRNRLHFSNGVLTDTFCVTVDVNNKPTETLHVNNGIHTRLGKSFLATFVSKRHQLATLFHLASSKKAYELKTKNHCLCSVIQKDRKPMTACGIIFCGCSCNIIVGIVLTDSTCFGDFAHVFNTVRASVWLLHRYGYNQWN